MQKLPEGIERTIIVLTPPTKAMLDELVTYFKSIRPSHLPKANRSQIIRDMIYLEYHDKLDRGLVKDVTK